jgi:hypothetical protein
MHQAERLKKMVATLERNVGGSGLSIAAPGKSLSALDESGKRLPSQ